MTSRRGHRSSSGGREGGKSTSLRRSGWRSTRMRRALIVLAAVTSLILIVAGVYTVKSLEALNDIKRDDTLMPSGSRPPTVAASKPINFVLMGSDSRDDQRGRSDSLMIVHLNGARDKVYLISFPRDMYVEIPAHGENKINAAYALGGLPLTIETLESLLNVRMQHAVVVDFDGFLGLTEMLGGVTVFNQYPFTSSAEGGPFEFPRGNVTIEGNEALAYVRDRYGLASGDLGRAERQRAVVKAVVLKLLRPEVIGNPVTFSRASSRLGKLFTVDSGLTNEVVWQLALDLKARKSGDMVSLQAPILGYATSSNGGAIDVVDHLQLADLATALRDDTMDVYNARYGHPPEALAVASAGNAIYVTQPASTTVSVVDATTHAVTATVPVGNGPEGLALDASTHTAYVTNSLSDTVSVINTKTRKRIASVPVGSRPSAVVVDQATHTVYVANTYSSTVSVIDQTTRRVIRSIPVENPWSLAVDSAAHRLYASSLANGAISVINTATGKLTSTIEIADAPLRIALDESSHTLYAANRKTGTVSVIDTAAHRVSATIKVGDWPQAIAVDPENHRVFVANGLSDTVTMIDTTTRTVIATEQVKSRPTGLAVDPVTHAVYVAHAGSDTLSVISP